MGTGKEMKKAKHLSLSLKIQLFKIRSSFYISIVDDDKTFPELKVTFTEIYVFFQHYAFPL